MIKILFFQLLLKKDQSQKKVLHLLIKNKKLYSKILLKQKENQVKRKTNLNSSLIKML